MSYYCTEVYFMSKLGEILYDPKKFFTLCLAVFFVVPMLLISLTGSHRGQALTIVSPRDCDDNAVIRCGALNFTELSNRSSQSGAAQIYAAFGISSQDLANMSSTAIEGTVTNNNNVWINRSSGMCPDIDKSSLNTQNQQAVQNNSSMCLVATNAMTAGRQYMSGSTMATSSGVTYFRRPPSVSFQSPSLPAFVVMTNGRFNYAIIASCGNPVTATPVSVTPAPAPQPKPAPQPTPQPQPTPPATPIQTPPATTTITNNNTNNNSNVNNNTVTVQAPPVVTQTAAPQPVQPAPAPVQQPVTQQSAPAPAQSQPVGKTLPNTGPGNVLALSGLSSVFATVGHLAYRRRKLV
jgi:hypothetical protein